MRLSEYHAALRQELDVMKDAYRQACDREHVLETQLAQARRWMEIAEGKRAVVQAENDRLETRCRNLETMLVSTRAAIRTLIPWGRPDGV